VHRTDGGGHARDSNAGGRHLLNKSLLEVLLVVVVEVAVVGDVRLLDKDLLLLAQPVGASARGVRVEILRGDAPVLDDPLIGVLHDSAVASLVLACANRRARQGFSQPADKAGKAHALPERERREEGTRRPPLSHCTSSSSETESSGLPDTFQAPSMAPVVEKAQQLPHWPWFLTSVTAPFVRQSTDSGTTVMLR